MDGLHSTLNNDSGGENPGMHAVDMATFKAGGIEVLGPSAFRQDTSSRSALIEQLQQELKTIETILADTRTTIPGPNHADASIHRLGSHALTSVPFRGQVISEIPTAVNRHVANTVEAGSMGSWHPEVPYATGHHMWAHLPSEVITTGVTDNFQRIQPVLMADHEISNLSFHRSKDPDTISTGQCTLNSRVSSVICSKTLDSEDN